MASENTDGYRDFGVQWTEFNKKDQLVKKVKFFKTLKARDQYISRLQKKDNFDAIWGTTILK